MFDATINHSVNQINEFALEDANAAGCLVRIHPCDGPGGVWTLDREESILGRVATCDVHLDDESVSRRHAVIQRIETKYFVEDLGSTNGTWVDDRRVSRHQLTAGERIRVGNQIVKFLSNDDIEVQFHETIYKVITTDGLTNAYNRRYLNEELERELARAIRRQHPLSMLLMDIDHFKQINDTFGHLAGDQVLQELSRRVQGAIEDDNVFARYGGEEFALVLSEDGPDEAFQMAERIRNLIGGTPFKADGQSLPITVSIGVACVEPGDERIEQLVERADLKLYAAKESGRNRVCR